jgi:hypothetical protein
VVLVVVFVLVFAFVFVEVELEVFGFGIVWVTPEAAYTGAKPAVKATATLSIPALTDLSLCDGWVRRWIIVTPPVVPGRGRRLPLIE